MNIFAMRRFFCLESNSPKVTVSPVSLYAVCFGVAAFAITQAEIAPTLSHHFRYISLVSGGICVLSEVIHRINACHFFSDTQVMKQTDKEKESNQQLEIATFRKPSTSYIIANFQDDSRINNEKSFNYLYKQIRAGASLIPRPKLKIFRIGSCILRLINHTSFIIDFNEKRELFVDSKSTKVEFTDDSCDVVAYHLLGNRDVIFFKQKDVGKLSGPDFFISKMWRNKILRDERPEILPNENPIKIFIQKENLTLINHTNYLDFTCVRAERDFYSGEPSFKIRDLLLHKKRIIRLPAAVSQAEVFPIKGNRNSIYLRLLYNTISKKEEAILYKFVWRFKYSKIKANFCFYEKSVKKLIAIQRKIVLIWKSFLDAKSIFALFLINKDVMFEISKKLFFVELKE